MTTFRPYSLSETIGLGEGVSAATGHSLFLEGVVWDAHSGSAAKPFCTGHLRIENKQSDQELGVFQIRNDQDKTYFTGAIFVETDKFVQIREILLAADAEVLVEIENRERKYLIEIFKNAATPPETVQISAASVGGKHHTKFLVKRVQR